MQRQIIRIDAARCDGCAQCTRSCPEGALQMIDGKARVVSEATCDGLGACIGECPQGAISIEVRDAAPYDELETLKGIVPQGMATLKAHLKHLHDHAQTAYLDQALTYLSRQGMAIPEFKSEAPHQGCPGTVHRSLPTLGGPIGTLALSSQRDGVSQLTQWPIQLHLIHPQNPVFSRQRVLLVADCVAFALPDFNQRYLPGNRLLVACPKLDQNQDIYLTKLVALIDEAAIESLHVLIMEVPCCGGLLRLAQAAAQQAERKIMITTTTVGISGEVIH